MLDSSYSISETLGRGLRTATPSRESRKRLHPWSRDARDREIPGREEVVEGQKDLMPG